jgi:outer membrane protein assembly factor BamB
VIPRRLFLPALTFTLASSLLPRGSVPTAAGASSPAAIELRPDVGPPTLPFTVQGQGFGASEIVDVSFDGSPIGTATTDPNGSFSKVVSTPTTASPGSHPVSATGRTSGSTATSIFLVRTNWPRFHFDNANTGYNPYENVISTSNVGNLVQKWSVPTAADIFGPDPIVAYGRVYVAPSDGIVRALDPVTGAVLWTYESGGSMSGTAPTAAHGLIYVSNESGRIVALAASTGVPRWIVDKPGAGFYSPVVTDRAVYVSVGATMYAFDAFTGTTEWAEPLNPFASPTAGSGRLLSVGPNCFIQAADPKDGDLLWYHDWCGEVLGPMNAPALWHGFLFQADWNLHKMNPKNGNVLWTNWDVTAQFRSPAVSNLVVTPGNRQPFEESVLLAFDPESGDLRWRAVLPGKTLSTAALANGVAFVGSSDGLRAYEEATGALLWQSSTVTAFNSSPAVSDGTVFASDADGNVYAIGLP